MRCVIAYVSRRTGVVVNRNNQRSLDGAIPFDDLDVGVGLIGQNDVNNHAARIGIYGHDGNESTFRHAVNLDLVSGRPIGRGGKNGTSLSETDVVMANWIGPALLDERICDGYYRWKSAPRVPISQLDAEERREANGNLQFTERRSFFARERRLSAGVMLFNHKLELDESAWGGFVPAKEMLVTVGPVDGAERAEISTNTLITSMLHRFILGLGDKHRGFSEIKGALMSAIHMISRIKADDGGHASLESSARRFSRSLMQSATEYLEKTGQTTQARIDMLKSAMDTFAVCGVAGEHVNCSISKAGTGASHEFPSYVFVKPHHSMQVGSMNMSSMRLPDRLSEVFG